MHRIRAEGISGKEKGINRHLVAKYCDSLQFTLASVTHYECKDM